MAFRVVMPRLGWTMEKGRLVEWLKRDGDSVRVGEPLFTVESEKAVQEVEALEGGILRIPPGMPPPDAEVPVGTLLGYLLQPGEPLPEESMAPRTVIVAPPGAAAAPEEPSIEATTTRATARQKVAISPRARRVARELGVDWAPLQGSGRMGRIVERDVRRAAAMARRGPAPVPVLPRSALATAGAAPVTLHSDADVTDLAALAGRFEAIWPEGTPPLPGYLCLLLKVVGLSLQEHPLLNAALMSGNIALHRQVNIALAVEKHAGLSWVVLRDAPAMSVQHIAEEAGRLVRDEDGSPATGGVVTGTFSLIPLGSYGIDVFTPPLYPSQCATLGIGRMVVRPAVHQGQIMPRQRMGLSLTFDHRIVDGAPAARFLQTVREYVEQPDRWLFR